MAEVTRLQTTCCIAGGGPAGVMLGYLLARAGVDVMVLEKHADFFRDFRGDTIHPSTMEVLHELGILDDFLKIPHGKAETIGGDIGGFTFTAADMRHLPTKCKYIAFAPQWDFLNFLAEKGRRYPKFQLKLEHEVTDLVQDNGTVIGVLANSKQGPVEVLADLVVAADGRGSRVREASGLKVRDLGAPFDVLWMRIRRVGSDPNQSLGHFGAGAGLIMINRNDYWQCGFLIAKGSLDRLKAAGLEAFQRKIVEMAPSLHDRVNELDTWDKIKLLTVQVNRLSRWHQPGLLCIGDAAHAMSPVGGVGVNLAIQDAVATGNILAEPLREGTVTDDTLAHVQARREWPVEVTQGAQVFIQEHFLKHILASRKKPEPPLMARLLEAIPPLRRLPARMIGMGVRPEHVRVPEYTGK